MLTENSMIDTLKDFVQRLDDLGIEYMITGSFAMHAYVTGRLTFDIDAVVEISANDAARFAARFSPDYYVDQVKIINAVARNSMFNIINQVTGVKVDCIIRKSTEFEAGKFRRRRRSQLDGIDFWFISKDDLILSKLEWAKNSFSEKQFMDIRILVESTDELETLEKQISVLELNEVWEEFQRWKIRVGK